MEDQYLSGRAVLNCGDATAAEIDQEVMKMLKDAYDEAKSMLAAHRESLDKIADFLIERETITGKEFMEIFHKVEGGGESIEGETCEQLPEKEEETGAEAIVAPV